MYPIEIKLADKRGWHTPAEAQAYYGRYSREGITVHWWGDPNLNPDSAHDNIVNYILGKARAGTGSVNYVCSNNKITLLVNPDNVAWASQSGNPTTVSIEFSPHLNAEGYKKAGWLIKELEGRYGRGLRLYPHKHWFATACPGTLDLNRMRAEADKWKAGGYNPAPAPAPKPPTTAKLTWSKLTASEAKEYVCNKQPTNLWDFNKTSWDMTSKGQFAKGHRVTIYGKVVNETLKATYYLTEYSYTRKITNGFNVKDLDVYVAPAPKPPVEPPQPPPEQNQPQPPNPPAPVEPDRTAIIAFLTMLRNLIDEFLNKFKK